MTAHEWDHLSRETGLPLSDLLAMTPRELDDLLWSSEGEDEECPDADDFGWIGVPYEGPEVTWEDVYGTLDREPEALPLVDPKTERGWDW